MNIDLPSGLKVKMMKLSPFKFLKLSQEITNENEMLQRLIIDLSVEPKISEEPTSENNLCIYSIEPKDASVLINTIMKDIGEFKIESFRE